MLKTDVDTSETISTSSPTKRTRLFDFSANMIVLILSLLAGKYNFCHLMNLLLTARCMGYRLITLKGVDHSGLVRAAGRIKYL